MSWLYPGCVVHRSALPEITARQPVAGVTVKPRLVASRSCQVVPSLLVNRYCWVLTAVAGLLPAGNSCTVNRVGENVLEPEGQGPAPATITSPLLVVFLLVFQRSFRWEGVLAVSGGT